MRSSSKAKLKKHLRINLRVPLTSKRLYERAAQVKGLTLSSYLRLVLDEDAHRVLGQQHVIELSLQGFEGALDLLESKRASSPNLVAAVRRVRKERGESHDVDD